MRGLFILIVYDGCYLFRGAVSALAPRPAGRSSGKGLARERPPPALVADARDGRHSNAGVSLATRGPDRCRCVTGPRGAAWRQDRPLGLGRAPLPW